MSRVTFMGYNRKEIKNKFAEFFKKYKDEVGYTRHTYLLSNSNAKFIFKKFYDQGEFSFNFVNGNHKITKYIFNNEFVKVTYKNDKCHNILGPARISYKESKGYRYFYAIDGKYMSRQEHKNYIQKVLSTTNFNKYRSFKTLDTMIEIYKFYDRKEQLEEATKRLQLVKIIKNLEKR